MENLSDDEDINKTWEHNKDNINTTAQESLCLHELKQHKPWFDEEYLSFLDPGKQAKMHLVQDPNQSNSDNPNSVRYEGSRQSRTKRMNT